MPAAVAGAAAEDEDARVGPLGAEAVLADGVPAVAAEAAGAAAEAGLLFGAPAREEGAAAACAVLACAADVGLGMSLTELPAAAAAATVGTVALPPVLLCPIAPLLSYWC